MMYGYGFDSTFNALNNTASSASSITLKSTGDADNPVVGDVLYFSKVYASTDGSLEDYSATTVVFKRDGVAITLLTGAKQYNVVQADIGAELSLEVAIKEQGGTTQDTLTDTCANVVTGSGWLIGELQDSFEALYDTTRNVFPIIQRHASDEANEVYKLKSLVGNQVDLKAPQLGNIYWYDTDHVTAAGSGRMYFTNPVEGWDGTAGAMFFKVKLITPSLDFWLYRYMGATTRYLTYYNTPHEKLEMNGITAGANTLQDGDEVIIIQRFSDTAFTTKEPVASQKTEFYFRVDDGVTPVEHHYDAATNLLSGSDFSFGYGAGATAFWTTSSEVKAAGFSSSFLSDADMDDLLTYLIAL